ncbi:unnamed protein product [Caenorhabditis auriculariae]|uniref:Actin-interacting protein 1 n=1 Tax=Caenorhabditis auriculariae TaxID=2777116 RepID=A0A8S1H2R2_9PELO|nr:unnamed protein product [Caenorhabditis auriculariae]
MSGEEFTRGPVFASLPKTTRGLPTVLGASPNGEKILYCNSNSVYIVPVDNLTEADIYTEHPIATTVAKMSPSGFYVASGDNHGNVRIWDTVNSTHILKATYQVFSGPVRDIAWNDDSKRIAAVGEGKERFGHVFLFDTGTSNGNLSGQSRPMSSVDFRPTRPYRIISGSEDNTIALFEGPPFKFKTTFHEHSRFVHVTRYSPDGALFASAGADGKVLLFEGSEGSLVGELTDPSVSTGAAHSGGVFGLAWSHDNQRIATASGDKTVKIWNVPAKSLEKTVNFGNGVEDQQLGIQWTKKVLVSVSLSGFLSFINPELGAVDTVRHGHNKPITALAVSSDYKYLFTSDFEGNTTRWEIASGASKRIRPVLHKSQVVGLSFSNKNELFSVGWDDTLQVTPITDDNVEAVRSSSVKLASQPLGLASTPDGSVAVVACYKHIVLFQNGKQVAEVPIGFSSSSVSISADKSLVAVGGQDAKVHIYSLSGTNLAEKKVLTHSAPITSVAFSPNGEYLAVTDSGRKVVPYSVSKDFVTASEKEWTFHSAKVNCVAWSPDSTRLATGGLDTHIIVWSLKHSGEHPVIIRGAHTMSPVNGIAWLSDKRILSVGQDANVKQWDVPN